MTNDYFYHTEGMFFKHEISENMPPDAYSMHIHNFYELIYFLDGNATHVVEDRKYKLKKGDVILIHPLQYHFVQIDSSSRYERYVILFDPEMHSIESIDLINDSIGVINIKENEIAEDIFRKIDFYHKGCDEEVFSKLLSHLLNELFYNLYVFPNFSSKEGASCSPMIMKALQYINDNINTITDINEVAERIFISESYLFRLFKKELHQTPKKYIREKRLLMAHKMLLSGKKPSYVCEKCGFSDYTAFYRNYTAFFGRSPREDSNQNP